MTYHIIRARLMKVNGHVEEISTIKPDIMVSDIGAYRQQLMIQYDANRVHFTYEEVGI